MHRDSQILDYLKKRNSSWGTSQIQIKLKMSQWPLAVLLGDSQTQLGWQEGGWVAGLADTFQRRVGAFDLYWFKY